MPRRVELLNKRTVYEGYYNLEEVTFRHTRVDGSMSDAVNRVVLDIGDVVAGLVLRSADRKVLLVEQFRYPASLRGDGWMIEVVAGRVDSGENLEGAFRREVEEEIGFAIRDVRQIHRFYPAAGAVAEHMTLFVAEAGEQLNQGGGTDDDEDIRVLEWDYDAFFEALDSGRIIDAKTLIAGYWLRAREGTSR